MATPTVIKPNYALSKKANFFTEPDRLNPDAFKRLDTKNTEKWRRFGSVTSMDYKWLTAGNGFANTAAINCLVIKPQDCGNDPLPVHVKWHGGGFFTGSNDYWPWFANHLIDVANEQKCVLLAPNYRLLGEHEGKDIMEDIRDFWKWFKDVSFDVPLDRTRVMVSGESAGGFCAAYSWFVGANVNTVFLLYPMLEQYEKKKSQYMTKDVTQTLEELEVICDDFSKTKHEMATRNQLEHITKAAPPDRMPMAYATSVTGKWKYFFNHDDILQQLDAMSTKPSASPNIVILHGENDTAVPYRVSEDFKTLVEAKKWGINVDLIPAKGVDHGFDYELGCNDTLVKDAVHKTNQYWIG